jgi:hypothetical protein
MGHPLYRRRYITCIAAAVLSTLLWIGGMFWAVGWDRYTQADAWNAWFGGGGIGLMYYRYEPNPSVTITWPENGWSAAPPKVWNFGGSVELRVGRWTSFGFFIPGWAPVIGFGWAAMILKRRAARAGCCPACAYPRSGLAPDDPCPECGHKP